VIVRFLVSMVLVLGGTAGIAAQSADNLDQTLARVGERVLQWYDRAQTIVSTETVTIQPLRSDFAPDGFPRRLTYELRVGWDPESAGPGDLPEATVLRQLMAVNGRPPRPRDEPQCMDPKAITTEPLTMLLPSRRERFVFSLAGNTTLDGRAAVMIDYRGAAIDTPTIEWTEDCVSLELPGRSRGRIWVDAETFDVLRLDEHLIGLFDFDVPRRFSRAGSPTHMTIERADTTIRYRSVQFDDPRETLMLPASVESVQVVRGSGIQRHRITQAFTDYRRFLTEGRILQ
jgi:hypothetical protein